jgi:hypothetical protein
MMRGGTVPTAIKRHESRGRSCQGRGIGKVQPDHRSSIDRSTDAERERERERMHFAALMQQTEENLNSQNKQNDNRNRVCEGEFLTPKVSWPQMPSNRDVPQTVYKSVPSYCVIPALLAERGYALKPDSAKRLQRGGALPSRVGSTTDEARPESELESESSSSSSSL